VFQPEHSDSRAFAFDQDRFTVHLVERPERKFIAHFGLGPVISALDGNGGYDQFDDLFTVKFNGLNAGHFGGGRQ